VLELLKTRACAAKYDTLFSGEQVRQKAEGVRRKEKGERERSKGKTVRNT
jgi:hypothetical protein